MILDLLKNNITSHEEQNERIRICKSCENYKIFYCLKCGCTLSLKTKLSKSKCPIGKWGNNNAV